MPHQRSVLWEDLRRPEFEALNREQAVVLIPFAALEQHGPHLPVSTDIANVRAVAVKAAELASEGPVLVLPVVWMGVSTFHMPWQGTVTLQPETFIRVVIDLCLSLQQQGLRRIVLLNGHGGNTALLQTAALQLREHGLLVAANASYWSLIPEEITRLCEPDGGALGHASHAETSLQLYLQPQHVDRTTMTAQQKGTMSPWGIPQDLMRGMYMVPEFATYAPSGVGGDHTQATVEVGQRIVDAAARTLAQFIEAYRHLPMEAE